MEGHSVHTGLRLNEENQTTVCIPAPETKGHVRIADAKRAAGVTGKTASGGLRGTGALIWRSSENLAFVCSAVFVF